MAKKKFVIKKPVKAKIPAGSFTLNEQLIITKESHVDLLKYLLARLEFGNIGRAAVIGAYTEIDKEVAGYLKLDKEDLKRQKDNQAGNGVKPVDTKLPLIAAQLDEAVTYLMQVLAPEEGMYQAVAPEEQQKVAKGFTSLMNKQGAEYKHYMHLARGFFQALKYNIGIWTVDWDERTGNVISNNTVGTAAEITEQVVAAGNKLEAISPYNFLCDQSVDPVDLPQEGEFFATIKLKSPFNLRRAAARGNAWNIDAALLKTEYVHKWYQEQPVIRGTNVAQKQASWIEILSGGEEDEFGTSSRVVEEVTMYIWLPAKALGLSTDDNYQLWKFKILNGNTIIYGRQEEAAHGVLPVSIARPWDDGFAAQSKSYAEMLVPYQTFASFQMNIHQRSARKALYATTFYDESVIPDFPDDAMLGGKIPAKPSGTNKELDLNKAVRQFQDTPATQNTIRDISTMDTLMQKVLPTDLLKQVTNLERATQYQAAATVQGANRRNLRIAKVIDAQALTVQRHVMIYNVMQFQQSVSILDDNGETVEINPSDLRDSDIEFVISDGLKGLDKLMIIESIKDVLNNILQSKHASETIDVVKVIDYYTSMIGDHTNFVQFRFDNEFDKLDKEQKQMAFQLLQQAAQQAQAEQGGAPAPSPQELPA